MLDLIILIMVSVSMVNIIQTETIFSFFREFLYNKYPKTYSFVTCPSCCGFWCGVFIGIFIPIYNTFIINILVCGFISSISNKIYNKLIPEGFGIL